MHDARGTLGREPLRVKLIEGEYQSAPAGEFDGGRLAASYRSFGFGATGSSPRGQRQVSLICLSLAPFPFIFHPITPGVCTHFAPTHGTSVPDVNARTHRKRNDRCRNVQ